MEKSLLIMFLRDIKSNLFEAHEAKDIKAKDQNIELASSKIEELEDLLLEVHEQ